MQQNQTEELGTCSVGKLLFKLAVPAIAAQIINLLYNLIAPKEERKHISVIMIVLAILFVLKLIYL